MVCLGKVFLALGQREKRTGKMQPQTGVGGIGCKECEECKERKGVWPDYSSGVFGPSSSLWGLL
ncbi:MAG TPA: hypothetical protein DEX10_00300 [Betaproteobacteria bacterium]|nr:hypothetical protein [Betaproteobacteria bacterium]